MLSSKKSKDYIRIRCIIFGSLLDHKEEREQQVHRSQYGLSNMVSVDGKSFREFLANQEKLFC